MKVALERTPYVCRTCGALKHREHTAADRPLTKKWKARCTSGKCLGARRWFLPAKRPLTGDYR